MNADQRKQSRKPITLLVSEEYGAEKQFLGLAMDMSSTGMSLVTVTDSDTPHGKHTWLRFWLPGFEEAISALGEVIHRTSQGDTMRSGIRFKYIFPAHRRVLNAYLNS